MKYKVNEIFYSIQGEGANTGMPTWFIRLSGCNLKCKWCDTDFKKYKELSVIEILKALKSNSCKNVTITGGEPLINNLKPLVKELKHLNYYVFLETNGTIFSKDIYLIDWITCSPKENANYKYKIYADEIKLVVDKGFNTKILKKFETCNTTRLYLQPEGNKKLMIDKTIKLVKENPKWRLSLQTHKLLKIA